MTTYIENLYNQVILTRTREDNKIPLNTTGNTIVKIETMLSTLNKHINRSDRDFVDYSLSGFPNQNIVPLNELFCDNIIVFIPIENRYLIKVNENNEAEIIIANVPKNLLGENNC